MKILLVGSGGREHALAWKIAQSPLLTKLYCAPGNPGTEAVGENVPVAESDISGLAALAAKRGIDLTVVGPELPLTLGIVDEFERRSLRIFGPSKKAAELEGSKVFAKQFMDRHRIPTARFKVAESPSQAFRVLKSGEFSFPLVIKADGLAAGKGVIICPGQRQAEEAVESIMVNMQFGAAGKRILIEEHLKGKELSFIVISDGAKMQPLVTTMDHKAVYDGDRGPNTGGMGVISPSPFVTPALFADIVGAIVFPTITRMREEGRTFKGVLYVGLMLTDGGPKVLEYNCRFGDPETQVQMMRLESDLVELMLNAVNDNVLKSEVRWNARAGGCVVLASGGYPLAYEKGKPISGLKEVSAIPGITIFHAGTKVENGEYYTNGGRVLNVCASEPTLAETMENIYSAIAAISFDGLHFRRDIGVVR
ncbi:MAG: phosphoribosylamine--glycine ligase [Candidatus Aminicenantes bacterium RBG_16_63_16]|nr:MAG: phosphoribosylamine--glycine ligase [Candidatus Aminicenantes bacterium RBG_16_63_16]